MLTMKKLVALMLALAMVMMVGTTFAATIEVKNVIDDETYTAYKLLNYTKSGDDENAAYSYYLTADEYDAIGEVLEAAGFAFTASSDGSQYTVNNAESFDPAAAAEYLGAHVDDLGSALGTATATGANGEAVFTNLATGYYFVTSSTGSLCALHGDTDIAEAVEKNTVPELDKKQSATEDEDYADTTLDFNVGDTVYYQVEIKDGKGTNAAITLTDVMTTGLTYKKDAKVYVENAEVTAGENTFTLTNNDDGFVIVFAPTYVASLNEGDIITVKYSAEINDKAVVDAADTNKNTATLEYSEQTQTDKVDLETYDFIVYKTDGSEFLDGAEFKLYDAATEGGQILIADEGDGEYVKDDSASADVTIDINAATGCHVRGLAPGTYYLEEVVVPDGYNKLSERTAVTIESSAITAVEVTVVNQAGAELPSTGGMGTTIFYVIGGLLIIGAAVVLVARRKAQD